MCAFIAIAPVLPLEVSCSMLFRGAFAFFITDGLRFLKPKQHWTRF